MEDNGWHFPQFTIMIQWGLCGGKVDYKIIQLCRCWSLELSVIIQSKHGQVNGPLWRSRGRGLNYFIIITIISPSGVWPGGGGGQATQCYIIIWSEGRKQRDAESQVTARYMSSSEAETWAELGSGMQSVMLVIGQMSMFVPIFLLLEIKESWVLCSEFWMGRCKIEDGAGGCKWKRRK